MKRQNFAFRLLLGLIYTVKVALKSVQIHNDYKFWFHQMMPLL